MKILFDTRHYVLDKEVGKLADSVSVYILERVGLNDAGGIKQATSVAVEHVGSDFERRLVSWGIEITLPTFIKSYNRIVSEISPDVIVVADFFRLSSWQAVFYKWRHPQVRLVLICETKRWPTRWLSDAFMKVMLFLWRHAGGAVEKVIVYTEDGRHFFTENWPEVMVSIVPPCLDTDFFHPHGEKIFMKNGVLKILMNARFVDYKRHNLLCESLRRLKVNGLRFSLTLVGRDGQGQKRVEQIVTESGLTDEVRFIAPLPHDKLPELYRQHDLLVLPSYNEALGMVVPEAMSSGLPTVTSDTVGANIYVVPGATGLIFRTDDVEDLTSALRQCFDPTRLQSFGLMAREHMVHHHACARDGDRLIKELL